MNAFHSAATIKSIIDNAIDGELTEADEQAIQDAFEDLSSYAEWIHEQDKLADGRIAVRKARIDQLRAENGYDENRQERRRQRLADAMRLAGMAKIKTPLVSCSFRRDPAVVVECDPITLPLQFTRVKTVIEADKVKLKETWKAGGELPVGVRVEERESLTVKG